MPVKGQIYAYKVKLSRIIILFFWFWVNICRLRIKKNFLDAYAVVVGPAFPRSPDRGVSNIGSKFWPSWTRRSYAKYILMDKMK